MEEQPYEKKVKHYSLDDLFYIRAHIDKNAYPERYRLVLEEIENRKELCHQQATPVSPPDPVSKYDTFWPRVGASVVDSFVLMPLTAMASFFGSQVNSLAGEVSLNYLTTLLFYSYSILLHGTYGQTVGKRVARVRVLDISEGKLNMSQAIARDGVPLSLAMLSLVMLPLIEMPTDPNPQNMQRDMSMSKVSG